MHVHITINGDARTSVGATTTGGALPAAGSPDGEMSPEAAAAAPGSQAINAGAAPSALAFRPGDGGTGGGKTSGEHPGASDLSAGPAPQF